MSEKKLHAHTDKEILEAFRQVRAERRASEEVRKLTDDIVAAQREWLDEQPPTNVGTQNFITAILPLLDKAIKALRAMPDALRTNRRDALEEAAQVVDQCNREGPYNAICSAERIRALKEQP